MGISAEKESPIITSSALTTITWHHTRYTTVQLVMLGGGDRQGTQQIDSLGLLTLLHYRPPSGRKAKDLRPPSYFCLISTACYRTHIAAHSTPKTKTNRNNRSEKENLADIPQ